jgi:phosphonate transport system permease protein
LHSAVGGVLGWESLQAFAQSCTPTNAEYYGVALTKLSESIYLAFMATFFAVPVAFLLAFFAARNLTRHSAVMRAAYMAVRIYINVTRSIEPIIWAILFAVWIGIGPFAGSIALMIHSISSLIKQYSEAIENVDDGPIEALQATGANRIATAWFAVVPQVMLPYLAFTIYRWDINVRMATIIGLVGGGGIGGLLIQEQGLANWSKVGTIAFLIFVVVWSMDFLSARVREAIQ